VAQNNVSGCEKEGTHDDSMSSLWQVPEKGCHKGATMSVLDAIIDLICFVSSFVVLVLRSDFQHSAMSSDRRFLELIHQAAVSPIEGDLHPE